MNRLCYYCGEIATTVDHVIPRHLRGRLPDWRSRTVPACLECNVVLGKSWFRNLRDRRAALKRRLKQRHIALLRMPNWSDSELNKLGPDVRLFVEREIRRRHWIIGRLEYRSNKIEVVVKSKYASPRRRFDSSAPFSGLIVWKASSITYRRKDRKLVTNRFLG